LLCPPPAVSWVLIYRTEDYQKLKKQVDVLQAKVDKKKSESKEVAAASGKDGAAKKAGALEEQLTQRTRDLSMKKMKSTFFVGFILLGVFGLLNSLFEGRSTRTHPSRCCDCTLPQRRTLQWQPATPAREVHTVSPVLQQLCMVSCRPLHLLFVFPFVSPLQVNPSRSFPSSRSVSFRA